MGQLSLSGVLATTQKQKGVNSPDDVIVSFARIELDSEPARISSRIGKLSAQCDRRESNEDRSLLTNGAQEVRFR